MASPKQHISGSTASAKPGMSISLRTALLASAFGVSALASNAALAIAIVPAAATTVDFDFNPVTTTNVNGMKLSTTFGNGVGQAASPTAISAYMTSVLQSSGYTNASVTATGAIGTATYAGEGHVWGDSLGTSNGATFSNQNTTSAAAKTTITPNGTDGFLINNNFGDFGLPTSSKIVLQFNNFVVDSISYDWEIFPDITCPDSTTSACTTTPDISLWANGKLVSGSSFSADRRNLVANPDVLGRVYAPQDMGTISTALKLNGASLLEFRDWPAEIGIDNLKITGHAVSEPASVPLMITGLLAVGWLGRRRRQG